MGTCGIAGFAPEVNRKCLGATKPELLEEESGGRGSCHRTSRGAVLRASTSRQYE
jgi:hypothetical protein